MDEKLSRRGFLEFSGKGILGLAASKTLRPLETIAASKHNSDDGIIEVIRESIEKLNKGKTNEIYREAYECLDEAVNKSKRSYLGLNSRDLNSGYFRGTEIVALARQAQILTSLATYNIIGKNEPMNLTGIKSPVVSHADIGEYVKQYNLLKALSDYERILDIFEEAKSKNIKIPSFVGEGKLGRYGDVIEAYVLKKRIDSTVEALRQRISDKSPKGLQINFSPYNGVADFLDMTQKKLNTQYDSLVRKLL